VGVEHEWTGVLVGELEHCALALTEGHDVGPLEALQIGPGAIQPEEIAVEVERVQQVKLGHVDQVHPNQLVLGHLNGIFLIVEGDGIDRVDLVLTIEIGVEAVHHHDHLAGRRPARFRVDDERPVQALVNVPLDGNGVAVIQMQPERLGVELIHEALAPAYRLEGPVHARGVDPMEMDAVGVAPLIDEPHPNPVALGAANGGPGYLSIVGPCRIEDPGGNLDLTVFRHQLILAQHLPRGEPGHLAGIEVGEKGVGIE
jgi:hypothetical protein